jgi:hypothetical protein
MTPGPVAYVRDVLQGLTAPWFLCGGWAADAWLGRQTRDHADVDIALRHDDQHAVFTRLTGWTLVGHDPNVPDDTDEPWTGRHLDPPAHIHVPTAASPLAGTAGTRHAEYEFEFLLNEHAGPDLVLNSEHRITTPLARCVRESPWGVPTLAPEVVLFYKGRGNLSRRELETRTDRLRPRDQQDFEALLPTLTPPERAWLRDSLRRARPDHGWLPRL